MTSIHRTVALIASTAVICTAVFAKGSQAPGSCRTFSAEEVRTVSGAASGTITQSCRFDLPTTSRVCTIRTRLSATSFDLTFTDKYNSVGDFIDEVKVVPPIARIQLQSRRYSNGPGTNGDIKYEYDTAGRQIRLTSSVGGNVQVTTYGDWDPKGRPTTATISSRASTITLRYKYDDTKRTMTITGPAGTEVDTYDADGNMIREETGDGTGRAEYFIKINKTDKVCR